jgi:hypothetical protein
MVKEEESTIPSTVSNASVLAQAWLIGSDPPSESPTPS